jgi:hypothetical protein
LALASDVSALIVIELALASHVSALAKSREKKRGGGKVCVSNIWHGPFFLSQDKDSDEEALSNG